MIKMNKYIYLIILSLLIYLLSNIWMIESGFLKYLPYIIVLVLNSIVMLNNSNKIIKGKENNNFVLLKLLVLFQVFLIVFLSFKSILKFPIQNYLLLNGVIILDLITFIVLYALIFRVLNKKGNGGSGGNVPNSTY